MNKEQLKEAVGELNLVDTVFEVDGVSYIDTAVSVTQVYDLINQMDEPRKVIIPRFVADWYEQEGSRRKWWNWFYKWGGDQSDSRTVLEKRALEWMQDFNEGLFVDIFRNGYEVEKEPLYYVKLPNTNSESEYLYLAQGSISGDCWFNSRLERLDYESDAYNHQFTEQEIKLIDPRYWKFAEPVEEEELKAKLKEPERVVIPQFVADDIEELRQDGGYRTSTGVGRWISREGRTLRIKNETHKWLGGFASDNFKTFFSILSGVEYEIEKENLYRIKIGGFLYFVKFDDIMPVFVVDDTLGAVEEHAMITNKDEAEKIIRILGAGELEPEEESP